MTIILLDAGPLGLITNPRPAPQAIACRQWLDERLALGHQARVPEIVDYELRRELLRVHKTTGLRNLDALATRVGYLPLTTATLRQAAAFWAHLRQQGQATASDAALDADVILAAQAAILLALGENVVIATTNVGHLARLVPAKAWQDITT